ncbi:hypothetical protein V5279_21225 [Bradyrhizobium sp. 26S5]|uniref:hypothetical protein n=1 Tax=Bradyrhizobium sp. 26S5 TaxID=3139729 RepID=UPI0030CD6DA4
MKLAIFIAASVVVGLLAGLRIGYRRGFEGGVEAAERLYPTIKVCGESDTAHSERRA